MASVTGGVGFQDVVLCEAWQTCALIMVCNCGGVGSHTEIQSRRYLWAAIVDTSMVGAVLIETVMPPLVAARSGTFVRRAVAMAVQPCLAAAADIAHGRLIERGERGG